MPTLHLIDADSTQACPAVMASIRAQMRRGTDDTQELLLIGGAPIREAARRAGIERFRQLAPPFGKATRGLALHHWAKAHPDFGTVRCWSIGALAVAARLYPKAVLRLSLAHCPNQKELTQLQRVQHTGRGGNIDVAADNPVLAERLIAAGVRCRVSPLPLDLTPDIRLSDEQRRAIRRAWGVAEADGCAVALLSDHPALADANHAALCSALAGATLHGSAGRQPAVTLILHPRQNHRRRARDLFRGQTDRLHLAQDDRLAEPWAVLGAADAALALGPDAGGLSLRWALHAGLPVIAPATGPAGYIENPPPNLRLAQSEHQKHIAHLLHEALGVVQCSM